MRHSSRRKLGNVVEQPNGRWRARITCGERADGRPRTLTKTFNEKAQAESWIDAMGDRDISTITPALVQKRLDGMSPRKVTHAKSSISAVLT